MEGRGGGATEQGETVGRRGVGLQLEADSGLGGVVSVARVVGAAGRELQLRTDGQCPTGMGLETALGAHGSRELRVAFARVVGGGRDEGKMAREMAADEPTVVAPSGSARGAMVDGEVQAFVCLRTEIGVEHTGATHSPQPGFLHTAERVGLLRLKGQREEREEEKEGKEGFHRSERLAIFKK